MNREMKKRHYCKKCGVELQSVSYLENPEYCENCYAEGHKVRFDENGKPYCPHCGASAQDNINFLAALIHKYAHETGQENRILTGKLSQDFSRIMAEAVDFGIRGGYIIETKVMKEGMAIDITDKGRKIIKELMG